MIYEKCFVKFCFFAFLFFSGSRAVYEDSLTSRQKKLEEIRAYEGTYDPMTSRIEPSSKESYTITADRLREIRQYLMYPYYDYDNDGHRGDLEMNINTQNTQVNKQLTFLLPFFGFGLNYTWVSINGYLGFSDAPFNWRTYPLFFPVAEWPDSPDPSFIGPFYSKCNIGQLRPGEDENQKTPGVYWRLERDLPSRDDRLAVEIRERLKWDIREGIVGAAIYQPKHAIIVTWKNVTFAGGSVNTDAKYVTNTFQLVVTTDEIRTFAMFNYDYMTWTSHTEAGGSSDEGQGGVPAFVGFNAGNGTRAYEYTPYSQSLYIRDLAVAGYADDKPGRHIFRIDEYVLAGSCRREETLKQYPLVFSPDHGNMLGGTLVNVTGPCFETSYRITCQFDTVTTEGEVLDKNTAVCLMPQLFVSGYVDLGISVNGGPFYWSGRFLVETPLTTAEGVWFTDDSVYTKSPESIDINWLAGNLTQTHGATVSISLWGYRERSILPEIVYIDMLYDGVENWNREKEPFTISTADFENRENTQFLDLEMGFIMINLTEPEPAFKLKKSTAVWSHPIPIAWYFQYQWTEIYGDNWEINMCDKWIESDRNQRNFAYEIPRCPCLLVQAISDRGRFLPDFSCDKDGNTKCYYHYGASHCVRSALPNKDGAGQQCCYDRNGYLMMTSDQMWGGHPQRAHNLGKSPYDEANKVPSLSHWLHDTVAFYSCCKWQSEQSPGCTVYRFERRASQDCVGYQPPSAATTFGDPHMYTFDDLQYTFNGLGEFVLVRTDSIRHVLDVQGRFERIPENYMGNSKGSMLTAVAARDNVSSIVEIRKRPHDAIWRYHLDVINASSTLQATFLTKAKSSSCSPLEPGLKSKKIWVTLESGFIYPFHLPYNDTRGLFGNWTFDPTDDLVLPDGTPGPSDVTNLEVIHNEFGMKWVLDDKEDPYKAEAEYVNMQNGIVAGIVLAVIIPLLLALLCFVAYCRERVKKQRQEESDFSTYKPSAYSTGVAPTVKKVAPVTVSQPMPMSTPVDIEEENNQMKDETDYTSNHNHQEMPNHNHISRSSSSASSTTVDNSSETTFGVHSNEPEVTYYTGEPVNDKPVHFQNIHWGVEDTRTPSPSSSMSPHEVKRSQTPSSSQESAV
ncbi:Protein mesh [Armadillidium nasatum]|uniref:Protein mesh n=1 Tax=Armadillidium nasatum TaxID=96803 RepID=A0A5N5TMM2_9CRUS|nr:Protein mesh [Armadillidium nasatum]